MMFDPLIITCSVVGAELTKEDYPYLPTTPDEIAESAKSAVDAGASVIHLHARDKNGKSSQSIDVFREITEKIRKHCHVLIQYSTGGAVGTALNERCAPLKLQPDMASLSMGSMNFGNGIFENSENSIRAISDALKKNNVLPELEIFDYGMLETVGRFVKKGYLPKKFHIGFVLGVPGGMSGSIKNLVLLADRLSRGQTWSVAGIGRSQLPLAACAIAIGGHVRVGIEDNIYYRKGELVKSNQQLVERIARITNEMDRPVASFKDAKRILGI